ncbi:hypothetical protein C8F04DRAFT_1351097 [Mycena alexandri]|uniref:Btz domain-containing protein n=1 Tax=Mycena alexandri TaxID=1745969 RepID=A0AAD6XA25_9AGAR|nr:hypothetical protein C8F04DRAFT_1351097 [Mycena alexandri]
MPSKRVTRRRGRAPHADDSDDDEMERAAQTDSDSHESGSETDDSDSDSEPVSRHLTPNTSHSPDADEKPAPFFAATPAAWADMVDDPASLPVLTFGELDAHAVRKVRMAEPEPQPEPDEDDEEEQPVASSSRHSPAPPAPFVRRPASQSARQAYQHRLESDPSFVPVVGEFWGHDDRLLDKDLRSLSGWWRGRWQGRGARARGATVFPPRGRGRGAFSGPPVQHQEDPAPDSPLDRTWTHDGFEEMRRREDTRARPPPNNARGAAPPLRGTPPLRGGTNTGTLRGRGPPPSRVAGRIWYTMKPEYMWTKQHDAFLYFDPALKPRPGQPPGVRVRLPGQPPAIVRAIPRPSRARVAWSKPAPASEVEYVVRLPPPRRGGKGKATAETQEEEEEDVDSAFTVKLPPAHLHQPSLLHPNALLAPAPAPTAAQQQHPLQPDADGWVQPTPAAVALAAAASPPSAPAPHLPLSLAHPPASSPLSLQPHIHPHPPPYTAHAHAQPPAFFPFAPPPGFGHAFPPGPAFAPAHTHTPAPSFAHAGAGHGFSPEGSLFSGTPPPPGFATPPPGFSTPPPGFNSALPGMQLPPGVGLDARGMPYELVSGRPVVLQAPVPIPQPMAYPGVEIRAPGATSPPALAPGSVNGTTNGNANGVNANGAKSPAPTSPRSPHVNGSVGPLSPLSPLSRELGMPAHSGGHAHTKSKQLRTTAAAFVPGHTPAPSLAVPSSSSYPDQTQQYFAGGGYENGGGYESPRGSAYEYEGGGGGYPGAGAGVGAGGGGGGGGATYYYPYYGAPTPGPGDGAVYYQ